MPPNLNVMRVQIFLIYSIYLSFDKLRPLLMMVLDVFLERGDFQINVLSLINQMDLIQI